MSDGNAVDGMERTRVGHCKADETDVYAGRGSGGRHLNNTAIGTRGWLGNPHRLEDGYTRPESIDLFRDDFEARLRGDNEFREAIRDLAGKTLGCWCQRVVDDSPACHAEVIAEHADRLAGNADTGTSHDDPDVRTDGGVTRERRRLRRRDADSVRQHAGAGDQGRCPNGNRDCSRGAGGDLPCFDCLTGGEGDG